MSRDVHHYDMSAVANRAITAHRAGEQRGGRSVYDSSIWRQPKSFPRSNGSNFSDFQVIFFSSLELLHIAVYM